MRFFPTLRGALLGFLVVLLMVATRQCHADEQMIEVAGFGECANCKDQKIQTNHAFSGLQVTIDCKNQVGTIERWGVGKLNEEGKFKVSLPKEILKDGNLKHECYAQLHSASSAPCAAQNGLESIKVVTKTDANGKHITFEPAQKLTFSADLCTSATFWPAHKPLPKLPKIGFKKHPFGHKYKFPPSHKKPLPPVYPTPGPKTPEPPVTKPEPPVTVPQKPEPPSILKKPCPPEPKKKSKPEKPKKDEAKKKKPEKSKKEEPKKKKPEKPKKEPKKMPPVVKFPVEKPPIVTPPIINPPTETPPIKKLPCPPIFKKFPPKDFHHPKLPPFPTIPPKYFHHPKLPHLPLPPHIPHA